MSYSQSLEWSRTCSFHKRRKSTNTRFGFVRFDCQVTANVAVQKANGLWVDDRALEVKSADYGKDEDNSWVKSAQREKVVDRNQIEGATQKCWD
ncbi:hypothetical protein ACSBR1_028463 [Camellia fascicularis]